MAALAFKAIDYGANRIPDKFFESIPGGFFTPQEKKASKDHKRERRHKSEQRQDNRDRDRRRSRRDRTPPTDYSDYSGHDDTDHEREYGDKQRRHRAKSAGGDYTRKRSQSRGRGRHDQRSSDYDEEYGYADMNRNERTPEFPPPPSSEYRPYNPAEYIAPAPPAAAATGAAAGNAYYGRSPSIARPEYNYASQPQGPYPQPMPSAAAARYTPASAYTNSPVNANASLPSPSPYPPYNPAEYASQPQASYSPNPAYRTPGNAYASPPPFYRQQSHSQPSLAEYPPPENTLTYNEPSSRVDSTSSSRHRHHGDGKQHRARSADHHKRSRSRIADKFRDRFDSIDQRERGLAASVGGALAGGLAGRAVGHGTLSTLAGAAIGAFGVREMEKRQEKKKLGRDGDATPSLQERSRSRHGISKGEDYYTSPARSRERRPDRYDGGFDSYSDSDSDTRRGTRRRRNSRREPRRDFD